MKNLMMSAAMAGLLSASMASAQDKAPATGAEEAKGECHGINACKGKGECGGKTHACAGMNACKGKGWISMTEKDCKKKKGTFKVNKAHG